MIFMRFCETLSLWTFQADVIDIDLNPKSTDWTRFGTCDRFENRYRARFIRENL